MSDGMYFFNDIKESEDFDGAIEVSGGKFKGENNFYQFQGLFSVVDHVLEGYALIKDKSTDTTSRIPLLIHNFNDNEFNLTIPINNQQIKIVFKKERERPLMR